MTVRRPLEQVLGSLLQQGACFEGTPQEMFFRDMMLDGLEAAEQCKRVDFSDLGSLEVRKDLWEYLRGEEFNLQWDAHVSRMNIQVHMSTRLEKLALRQEASTELAAKVLSATKELLVCQKLQ